MNDITIRIAKIEDAEKLLIKLNKMSLDIAECKKTEIGFLTKFS